MSFLNPLPLSIRTHLHAQILKGEGRTMEELGYVRLASRAIARGLGARERRGKDEGLDLHHLCVMGALATTVDQSASRSHTHTRASQSLATCLRGRERREAALHDLVHRHVGVVDEEAEVGGHQLRVVQLCNGVGGA